MRNLLKSATFLSCAVVLAAALSAGVPTRAMADQKTVKVGFIHSMSGAMSMYGISAEAGAKIAIKEINAAGGVLGREIKLITRDDKLNPETGLREAKDLVLTEEVDFLMGTISSAVALAISDYARKAK